jgi:GTP-binding protein EngB required for normal cell division
MSIFKKKMMNYSTNYKKICFVSKLYCQSITPLIEESPKFSKIVSTFEKFKQNFLITSLKMDKIKNALTKNKNYPKKYKNSPIFLP